MPGPGTKSSDTMGLVVILVCCVLSFSSSIYSSIFIMNNSKSLGISGLFEQLKEATGIDLTSLNFGISPGSNFTYRDEGKSKDQGTFVEKMTDEQFNDMKAKMTDAGYGGANWSVTLTENHMGGYIDATNFQNISVFDDMKKGHFDSAWPDRKIDFKDTDKDFGNIDGYKFKFENWDPRLRFELESYHHYHKLDETKRVWTDPPAGSGTWDVSTKDDLNVGEHYNHDRFRIWLKWHDVPL